MAREQGVDVTLLDGSRAELRPVLASDHDEIRALLASMSDDSRYFRGCGLLNVDRLADWCVDVDYQDRYGVVATTGASQQIVAHAAYVRLSDRRAEIAFEVADAMQTHGLGTLLLDHLAAVGASNGVEEFVAEVMPVNRKMLEVLHWSGYPLVSEKTDGLTQVVIKTSGKIARVVNSPDS